MSDTGNRAGRQTADTRSGAAGTEANSSPGTRATREPGPERAAGERVHDAWLIDLDGTLYAAKPLKWKMAAELALFGWSAISTIRAFRSQHEVVRAMAEAGDLDPFQTQLQRAAEKLGRPVAEVESVIRDWMFVRPARHLRRHRRAELVAEIDRFRSAGGRCALVSDYPARTKLDALELGDRFDCVVASGEQGGPRRLKPNPEGYLSAAEALGIEPARCLVIGDRRDADGIAAERAGMDFRWVG